MFYIDDYNSKAITSTPPKRDQKSEVAKTKLELNSQQLAAFWHLTGITIADNYETVKFV